MDIVEALDFEEDGKTMLQDMTKLNNRIYRICDNFRMVGEFKNLSEDISVGVREKLTGSIDRKSVV